MYLRTFDCGRMCITNLIYFRGQFKHCNDLVICIQGELDLCDSLDPHCDGGGKKVVVGVCAMAKKSQSKPMKEILTRLDEFEYIKMLVFPEEVILKVLHIA